MRLIDADALKAVFEEKSSEAVCGVELCIAIIFRINEAPTIDAVPVVRCRECKYWQETELMDGRRCMVRDDEAEPLCALFKPDDYCSRAERKEE